MERVRRQNRCSWRRSLVLLAARAAIGRSATSSMARARGTRPARGGPPLSEFDTFLVDCDGVLWHGAAPIEGSIGAIHALRAAGKRLFFVTNNSAKSRAAYAAKFAALGVAVAADEIVTSGSATAAYLREAHPDVRAAYVIGEQGLADELRAVGVRVVADDESARASEADLAAAPLDGEVGAVVVGHDLAFSFRKLAMATAYLTERGSVFLATNADPFDMLPLQAGGRQQRRLPAAGCMVAAVAAASSEQPLVIGKPGGAMATVLLERLGLDPLRTCIVGDRLDTDIALAASAALGGSCLCLSGCTSAEMVSEAGWPALPDAHRPAYIVERFADLVPTP